MMNRYPPLKARVFPDTMPTIQLTEEQKTARYGMLIMGRANTVIKKECTAFNIWRSSDFQFDRHSSIKAVQTPTIDSNMRLQSGFYGFVHIMEGDESKLDNPQPMSMTRYLQPAMFLKFLAFLMERKVSWLRDQNNLQIAP